MGYAGGIFGSNNCAWLIIVLVIIFFFGFNFFGPLGGI
jgi:hypothetical protein